MFVCFFFLKKRYGDRIDKHHLDWSFFGYIPVYIHINHAFFVCVFIIQYYYSIRILRKTRRSSWLKIRGWPFFKLTIGKWTNHQRCMYFVDILSWILYELDEGRWLWLRLVVHWVVIKGGSIGRLDDCRLVVSDAIASPVHQVPLHWPWHVTHAHCWSPWYNRPFRTSSPPPRFCPFYFS